jgi:hypothetical protein
MLTPHPRPAGYHRIKGSPARNRGIKRLGRAQCLCFPRQDCPPPR